MSKIVKKMYVISGCFLNESEFEFLGESKKNLWRIPGENPGMISRRTSVNNFRLHFIGISEKKHFQEFSRTIDRRKSLKNIKES